LPPSQTVGCLNFRTVGCLLFLTPETPKKVLVGKLIVVKTTLLKTRLKVVEIIEEYERN